MYLEIVKSANSRRTQYAAKDVERALRDLNLSFTVPALMIYKTEDFDPSRRKEIEGRLRLVHRNIFYIVNVG